MSWGRVSLTFYFNLDIDAPSITTTPEQPFIGGNAFMQCFADMFPAATSIEWMKDGKKLSQGATLSLNDVQMKDSGTYQCIVMNEAGLKFNSTQLELSCRFTDLDKFLFFCCYN